MPKKKTGSKKKTANKPKLSKATQTKRRTARSVGRRKTVFVKGYCIKGYRRAAPRKK